MEPSIEIYTQTVVVITGHEPFQVVTPRYVKYLKEIDDVPRIGDQQHMSIPEVLESMIGSVSKDVIKEILLGHGDEIRAAAEAARNK